MPSMTCHLMGVTESAELQQYLFPANSYFYSVIILNLFFAVVFIITVAVLTAYCH